MTTHAPAAPIGWFEIAAPDTDKAEAFYSELFNWTFSASPAIPSYRLVDAGQGPGGGVTVAQAGLPPAYAIFSVMVADVAATCRRIEELGGKILVGPETLETGLDFANVEDPDGNHFGIFTPPEG